MNYVCFNKLFYDVIGKRPKLRWRESVRRDMEKAGVNNRKCVKRSRKGRCEQQGMCEERSG